MISQSASSFGLHSSHPRAIALKPQSFRSATVISTSTRRSVTSKHSASRSTLPAHLRPGVSYSDPTLNSVDYNVFGTLEPGTPSGFRAFNLERPLQGEVLTGAEFYAQGSSLSFAVSPAADLSDGLQVSELSGSDPVFVFDGREVDTGRYHPALLELNIGGTGSIRNSNNMGGVNPGSGEVVDVDVGEEYVTQLSFNPATLTIATVTIPEPGHFGVCSLACLAMMTIMRRRKA